ncbi:sulfotransferase domain-containing protein [Shewanella corallii]|uniref:Sulfotransferase domain-containing protein n=1 Tax=Shewanella corallii TaxID=560080 RepID=A0ABT0N6S9_9GAMM|nr:sulfotransferase domain-containing protein [Shewanella corallii]MCL2914158.1 sulfotransferase domain-containing protein [Shewanella corallii]
MNISFILGTPFSGSTIIGNTLSSLENCSYIGEIDRLPAFKSNNISTTICESCFSVSKECPVYSKDLIDKLSNIGVDINIYRELKSVLNVDHLVDGSKHITWFRTITSKFSLEEKANIRVIVTVKNPIMFALSYYKSLPVSNSEKNNRDFWSFAKLWRDTYIDIFRTLNIEGINYIVVKNEDLIEKQDHTIARMKNFLNLNANKDKAKDEIFHSIGGNPKVQLIKADRKFKINDEWITDMEYHEILQVINEPGIYELAVNTLGYDLTSNLEYYWKNKYIVSRNIDK